MEVWFYHLQSQPLARALPALLEKALERGWRSVVQTIDAAALKSVDDMLWTYTPESFLPHGSPGDKNAERQPIFVTCGADNPNAAALRLYVGAADVDLDPEASAYERVILMFDGRDDDELAGARRQWSRLKGQGFTLAYWQQSDEGRWERRI
jgi:DNA polymerase-3 subunit chi